MTLKEANYQVESKTNELNKLLRDKEILECMIDPKNTDFTKIIVDGGKHGNILEIYVALKDLKKWKDLDKKINRLQEEIQNLVKWIDEELRILKKYDKLEQLIVYYKEECQEKYTWYQISSKVNYSITQCRRIYRRYKQKRDIYEETRNI